MTAGAAGRGGHVALDLGVEDVFADAKQVLHRLVPEVVGARGVKEALDELAKHRLAVGIHEGAVEEEGGGVAKQLEGVLAVVRVGATDVGERELGDRGERHGLRLAVEMDGEGGWLVRDVGEPGRILQELAVAAAHLAEDAHGGVGVLVVVREGLEMLPERGHDVLCVGRHDGIEKLLGEVVDAEFEGAKALADELGGRLEREHERLHEIAEVGQKHAEADGHGEAKIDKDLASAGLCSVEERIEVLEQDGEERQDVLVEQLESAAADAAEESAEEEEVVGGLVGLAGELHGLHDEMAEVGLEHHLVLLWKDGDGHEGHLEEAQADGGVLLVRLAELLETVDEEAKEDADEALGDGVVAEEVLRDAEEGGRVEHLLEEEGHVGGEDLVEDLRLEVDEDGGEEVEHLLLLPALAVLVERPALDAVDEQPSCGGAVGMRGVAMAEDGDERLEAKEDVAEEEASVLERIAGDVEHDGGRLNGLAALDGDCIDGELVACVDCVDCVSLRLLLLLLLIFDLTQAIHVGSHAMQTGELLDKDVEDGGERLCGAVRMLCEDGLDEVEEELDAHGLDAGSEGGVVQDLGVDVDDTDELLGRKLLADVVYEVGEHADGEWPLGLVRGDAGADEDAFVEERVDLTDKVGAVLGGEDVACCDEELLAGCGSLGWTVLEEADADLGEDVGKGPHDGSGTSENVGEEGHGLDLGYDHVGVERSVLDGGSHADKDLALCACGLVSLALRFCLEREAALDDEGHKDLDMDFGSGLEAGAAGVAGVADVAAGVVEAEAVGVDVEAAASEVAAAAGCAVEEEAAGAAVESEAAAAVVVVLVLVVLVASEAAGGGGSGGGELGCFGLKGLLYGVLHVCVELLDEIEEGLHLILEDSFEGAMEVDDDLEGEHGIVLVVVAEDVEHGGHEGVCIGFEYVVLGHAMCCFEDDVAEALLGRVCDEAAWCCVEEGDVGGDDVLEEEGVVDVLEEVEEFLELERGG
ncbi:hypothetical protein L1887_50216 [Cichorium endivia]|nr:hypothetical protein L1887_50216 [Cichorium endivia]